MWEKGSLHEQDGPSPLGLSRTSHPHPGASRSTSGLSLVRRVGQQEGGLEQRHSLGDIPHGSQSDSPGLLVKSRAGQTIERWRGSCGWVTLLASQRAFLGLETPWCKPLGWLVCSPAVPCVRGLWASLSYSHLLGRPAELLLPRGKYCATSLRIHILVLWS